MKIKNKVIIIVAILSFIGFNTAKAQSHFGVRAGVNFANLAIDNVETNVNTGFKVGLYYTYMIQNSQIAIQPELLFSQKGAKKDLGSVTEKVNINYLEIPVLVKYMFNTVGNIRPEIYIGPYLGIKVGGQVKLKNKKASLSKDLQNVESADFGFIFGAGISFNKYNVGLRYSLGVSDIDATNTEASNRVFSIVVGYNF